MSSFAKTKCPRCGRVQSHWLGGWGFIAGDETTTCSCGYTYGNVENCIEDVQDRDEQSNSNLSSHSFKIMREAQNFDRDTKLLENMEYTMRFSERLQTIYRQKDREYKEKQESHAEEKKKEFEVESEKQIRYIIEKLIFPSLEKVVTECEVPIQPKAHFIIKDSLPFECRFFCGILDSDGWGVDTRYPSIGENEIKVDLSKLDTMRKIATEYGLLSKKEHLYTKEYDFSFWIKMTDL